MAKRYRLWPCQNRPREGPENLAKIETRAMEFLATPESQVGPFPRVGLYARVSTPHQHTIGMQLRQLREFLERRRWQEVLVVEEVASGSRRRPERDRLLSGPAASLRVIFHTAAAQAPGIYIPSFPVASFSA